MSAPLDLAALEAVAKAATPGPWGVLAESDGTCEVGHIDSAGIVASLCASEDAAHIAAFSPDVALALIAAARAGEELREKVAEYLAAREFAANNLISGGSFAPYLDAEAALRLAVKS